MLSLLHCCCTGQLDNTLILSLKLIFAVVLNRMSMGCIVFFANRDKLQRDKDKDEAQHRGELTVGI